MSGDGAERAVRRVAVRSRYGLHGGVDVGLRARIEGFLSSVGGAPSRAAADDQTTGHTCRQVGRLKADASDGAFSAGETAVCGGQSGAETK